MKLLTTIAAVLISISAYSQDYVDYNEGTFSRNGEELSMEQIKDLTVLHKAGRGNIRRAYKFDRMHKNNYLRLGNNIGGFVVGSCAGLLGVPFAIVGGLVVGNWDEDLGVGLGFGALGGGTGLCVVSYEAFSRITSSREGCLRRRDKQFKKVAEKLNDATYYKWLEEETGVEME